MTAERTQYHPAGQAVPAGTHPRARPATPRLALRPDEAAETLGISRGTFDAEVLPELRVIRIGRRWIIPVKALDEWLSKRAAVPLSSELER